MQKGDKVEIIGYGETLSAVVNDMQVFKKSVPIANAGDHVGVLTKGVKAEQVCFCDFTSRWGVTGFGYCVVVNNMGYCCRSVVANGLSLKSLYNYKIEFVLRCIYLRRTKAAARLASAMDSLRRCSVQHGMRFVCAEIGFERKMAEQPSISRFCVSSNEKNFYFRFVRVSGHFFCEIQDVFATEFTGNLRQKRFVSCRKCQK
jgi:hypothetical protein